MSALVEVEGVTKVFGRLTAVAGVSLTVQRGETLGIVGESGCGKSTLARLLVGLTPPTAGRVRFEGTDLAALKPAAMRALRRRMQLVFQDPYASLDPRLSVGASIAEPLVIHRIGSAAERRARVAELLHQVGLPADAAGRYPHEFSGGQRQRIGIARAVALQPDLIVADEPVSALDVSIQAQILNLLLDLKSALGLTLVFISHNLAVVEQVSDRVAVMYLGRIVEQGPAERLYRAPAHPYTKALIAAIPSPDPAAPRPVAAARGEPPNPEAPPPGCPFHPRCPAVFDRCRGVLPELKPVAGDQLAACHLY